MKSQVTSSNPFVPASKVLSHAGSVVDGKDEATLLQILGSDIECSLSIDSRTLQPGQLLLALEGERADGHAFIKEAVANGARGLIIDESKRACLEILPARERENLLIVTVADTLHALIELARTWRARFSIPVIGITGSLGKTTTKEILRSILKAADVPACISAGNQNSLIGMCLNVLKMRDHHRAAIFELGISERGEMPIKADILRPTIGVITSVAHAHTKCLGTIYDVVAEKRQLFSYFTPANIGIINGDLPLLASACYPHPIVRFGTKTKNQVQARKLRVVRAHDPRRVGMEFELHVYRERRTITVPTNHRGRLTNILAAAALAHFLDLDIDAIAKGITDYVSYPGRFCIRASEEYSATFIDDAYNANPESMRAALLALEELEPKGPKIAVLGDMLELGEKEVYWHRQIGRVLAKALSVKTIILVGPLAKLAAKTAPITQKCIPVENAAQAIEILKEVLKPEAVVLVKGSHAVGLQAVVDVFTRESAEVSVRSTVGSSEADKEWLNEE